MVKSSTDGTTEPDLIRLHKEIFLWKKSLILEKKHIALNSSAYLCKSLQDQNLAGGKAG